MSSTSSISGLASGLDTASIISQLMSLEAAPQTALKTRVTSENSVVSALQSVNTKFALLNDKASALAKTTAWSPLTATSSNSAVSVTTTSSASPTNLNVTVTSVAQTHQLGFTEAHALTDVVTGSSTSVTLDRFDGSPVTLDTGDGTLQGLVTAINSSANDTGLRATTIKVADGSYRLLVESKETGASQDFTLTAEDGSPLMGGATVRAGTDATIDLGTGITATSTTNTFTDLMPGVTLTLGSTATNGSTSTVTVARDSSGLSSKVSALVDSINDILSSIDTASAYDATNKTSGVLTGDSITRSLRGELLDTVYGSGYSSLASVGIQTTKDGLLTFDSTTFTQAYAADPDGVADMFSTTNNGFAARVSNVAKGASDSYSGTLTSAIKGHQSTITDLNNSISDWDTRLALRKTTLENTFTALETALSQMQSQSNWLSSQLASLSSG